MPELPEVHTTATGLARVARGKTILDVWTNLDSKDTRNTETHKNKNYFKTMRARLRGAKVLAVTRRAKNILVELANGYTMLIHLKMTGHLMYGKYIFDKKKNEWSVDPREKNDALRDPYNRFIRVVFSLSDGKHIAFSDSRKFGKIVVVPTREIHNSVHLSALGPEPLDKKFTLAKFKTAILRRPSAPLKAVLMDPSVIAGIGNIYSDEMLWLAGIHPLSKPSKVPSEKMKLLFSSMQKVLKRGIDFGGDSMSDYRDIDGRPGKFQNKHNAYRLTGKTCKKPGCSGTIKRIIVGGRSGHYCDEHQKLFA